MEENQQVQPQPVSTPTEVPQTPVRHRGESSGKGKKFAIILIIIAIILIIGSLLFYLGSSKNKSSEPTPTPSSIFVEEPTMMEEETPTPEPVDKNALSVQILNGTGIVGEASYLQGKFKTLGFEKIEVGNAPSQNQTDTTVTFSEDIPESLVDEVTTELEDTYSKVVTKTSSSASVDIQVITGLRKGQTSKPQATTAAATATPVVSPTASPTATPTPTP